MRQIDHGRQSVSDGVARVLGAGDVIPFYSALEIREVSLHRRDETGFPGARRRFQRLEGYVGVEGAIARFRRLSLAREVERAVEKRKDNW